MARDELLRRLDQEFDGLLAAVDGLDEQAAARVWYGDWCVRDILAHVAGWHREMAAAFERMARGERPVPEGTDYSDPNPWNARFAEAQMDSSLAQMVGELKASKEAFAAAAGQLPDDRFEEGRAAHRILHASGIDHYRTHAPEIREWRQREGK
ncbi:MAG: ClbS/DfsB family four-helix bundle protein [Chloroflexi bacterium]|nr:ClbS/DfsB family four-helix bundle protein [Chloroflexota bacterium]